MERVVPEMNQASCSRPRALKDQLAVLLCDLDTLVGAGPEGVHTRQRRGFRSGDWCGLRRPRIAKCVKILIHRLGLFPACLGVREQADTVRTGNSLCARLSC